MYPNSCAHRNCFKPEIITFLSIYLICPYTKINFILHMHFITHFSFYLKRLCKLIYIILDGSRKGIYEVIFDAIFLSVVPNIDYGYLLELPLWVVPNNCSALRASINCLYGLLNNEANCIQTPIGWLFLSLYGVIFL